MVALLPHGTEFRGPKNVHAPLFPQLPAQSPIVEAGSLSIQYQWGALPSKICPLGLLPSLMVHVCPETPGDRDFQCSIAHAHEICEIFLLLQLSLRRIQTIVK